MNRVLEPRNPTMLASSYEAPAFNLLRLELEWALEMVTQLKAKGRVSGAKDLLYQLQGQVLVPIKDSRRSADPLWCSSTGKASQVRQMPGAETQHPIQTLPSIGWLLWI